MPAHPAATWLRSYPPVPLKRRWRGWPHMTAILLACGAMAFLTWRGDVAGPARSLSDGVVASTDVLREGYFEIELFK